MCAWRSLNETAVFQNQYRATNKKGKSSQIPGFPLKAGFRVRDKDRLLETATAQFAEKGCAGTYVMEIVTRAGVTKPVLSLSA